ncbi:MAG TPA: hypothetical protein VGY48_15710 [Vicinamibacterales bacterium]|jgi:hypothetical protein|nr:hypothetical protein [Vicinamibacterales bacterium]
MSLPRRVRDILAIPLFIAAVPGLLAWGFGAVLTLVGRSMWMTAHKVCRDDNCACEECRDFDPEFVRSHTPPEPPAAA